MYRWQRKSFGLETQHDQSAEPRLHSEILLTLIHIRLRLLSSRSAALTPASLQSLIPQGWLI
jgi:hypothetical protein